MKKLFKIFLQIFGFYEAFVKLNTLCIKENNFNKSKIKRFLCALKMIPKISFVIIFETKPFIKESKYFRKICAKAKIKNRSQLFFYSPDFLILPILPSTFSDFTINKIQIGNLTVDYEKILSKGIFGIKNEISNKLTLMDKSRKRERMFLISLINICDSIEIYVKRAVNYLSHNNVKLAELVSKVPLNSATNFYEALQSILIVNSLLWMSDYPLMGLGRLDQILWEYYNKDIKIGLIDKKKALELIKEFLLLLHLDYKFKSNALPGDTGQVIVLGGKGLDEIDKSNELTLLFFEAMKELKLPDPKIVLRVNKHTSDDVWVSAIDLLKLGLGYPLFCNDDVIIPALINFGYSKEDAYNYQVSACWEPLIPGKSLDQNNIFNLNLLKPLELLLTNSEIKKDRSLFDNYLEKIEEYIKEVVSSLNKTKFKTAPLISLLTDNCIDRGKDISEGGAIYNNFGILCVGLANTIDSILNLEYLLHKGIISNLEEAREILKNNFEGYEFIYEYVKNIPPHFGTDENKYVIQMVNKIISTINEALRTTTNPFGGKYKFGLSSPSFISSGNLTLTSFDGRKKGEPLGVHISPIKNGIEIVSLLNFSSKLDYSKAFNGGVTDIILDEQFIKLYPQKFLVLLKTFFEMGGMQLQANVVNYKVLKEAFKNPNAFPNLIVRVWGFSAYFKDLPKEYQQLILERYKIYAGDTFDN